MRALLLVGLLAMAGCTHPNGFARPDSSELDPVVRANHDAADEIHAKSASLLAVGEAVIITSAVRQDDLTRSSSLGRLVAEQVGGRLANHGIAVKEVRLRGDLYIRRETGELILSREIAEIARSHEAQAAVSGLYSPTENGTWVSIKLVRLDDARVLAASDYFLPITETLHRAGAAGDSATDRRKHRSLFEAVKDYNARVPY